MDRPYPRQRPQSESQHDETCECREHYQPRSRARSRVTNARNSRHGSGAGIPRFADALELPRVVGAFRKPGAETRFDLGAPTRAVQLHHPDGSLGARSTRRIFEAAFVVELHSVLFAHPVRQEQYGLRSVLLDHAERDTEQRRDLRKTVSLQPVEQKHLPLTRTQGQQTPLPML